MNTNIKKYTKKAAQCSILGLLLCASSSSLTSCSDFLDELKPQGTMTEEQITDPRYVDNLLVSAYAGLATMEDMNASFSLWNFDARSDDAYHGGANPGDIGPFHNLQLCVGIQTSDYPYGSIWSRYYNYLSRVSLSLNALSKADQNNEVIKERTAEMLFLRAYGHFQLKRLFKRIPFVNQLNMTPDDYNNLSNTKYSNDEAWQQIANDLETAFQGLPETQAEKARPTKAAAAALLAKVYLYKAYRQEDESSHKVTGVNKDDLLKVKEYTDPKYYKAYDLEEDMHNNFRPEEEYENGVESIWAIQYSRNDGTKYGNLNFSNRSIVPCIPKVHDSGSDQYKPSNSLVNAFCTTVEGLPAESVAQDYEVGQSQTVDPRLFITVGMPGVPYMFNTKFMMDKTNTWSRSGGQSGYNVSLKQNVDPDLKDEYLFLCDNQWASSMNRIVIRYADVLLMRAEALAQLGENGAVELINKVRQRAMGMTKKSIVSAYPGKYNIHYAIGTYPTNLSGEQLMKAIRTERRLEFAMEAERFFDLVRWGIAEETMNHFYSHDTMPFVAEGHFTKDKNEYLPIPFDQIAASNGHYKQNIGGW